MPVEAWDVDAWIDAMAPVVGLELTAAQRPGVRGFLAIAKAMAAELESVDLPDDKLEPAPVFTPAAPA
jgi:hypothetical protein